ncbi:sugar transferase [Alkalilacustris brevis]|uniref:sugar transferase n=1 Tax=Alkalilacustris brevis TaxID=2026338 RepID=UPI000E0DB27F|nr:sugar transferase [Alkalilacustris brevis]
MARRISDIALALVLAVPLLPVLLGLMLLVCLVDGRPALFASERVRAPGRHFRMWKLRTMQPGPDETGVCGGHKVWRITPLGRWLRKLRLDELPQLWNILRGDMSFVGPRPPEPQYVAQFPDLYARVLRRRPGVTGLATLIYHTHEERLLARCRTAREAERIYTRHCIPRKARLDLIYQARAGFWLDLWLLWRSALKVLPPFRQAGAALRGLRLGGAATPPRVVER